MKINIFKIFIFSLAFAGYGQAEAMDLTEALATAYRNNPTIKAERARLKATDEALPQAYSGWMPTLSADYSKGRENEKLGTNPESRILPSTKKLSLNQPIFSGGETLASINRAKNQIKAARARLDATEQQIMLEAVTAYVDVVRAREVLQLSEHNEKVLTEQLTATKDRFDLGETTTTDVAQSESRLARAQSDRIDAEGNLIIANSEFRRVFGITTPAEMAMPDVMEDVPEAGFNKAMEEAITDNPLLISAQYDAASAENNISIRKSDILPTVDLRGEISRSDELSSSLSASHIESESITVNVAIPLFQSGSEYSRVRQAKREAEDLKFKLAQTKEDVVNEFTQAWRNIQTARGNIKATKASVDAAKIALEGVRQEQLVGSRTILDVLDAEQELFTSQVQNVTAIRNGVVSIYRLKSALGKLTAQSMGLEVELFDPKEHYENVKYKMIGF